MEEVKRGPGRPPRKETTKTERRRRVDSVQQMRMVVPIEWKEFWNDYELRWINDNKGRLHQMTKNDDWDICYHHELPDAKPVGDGGEGQPIISQAVSVGGDGRAFNAYLCRKRKEYFEADKKAKQDALKKQEDAMLTYKTSTGEGLNVQDDTTYVPSKP